MRCHPRPVTHCRDLRDDRGATAVEYGLIAALVAVVILVAIVLLGGNLSGVFANAASSVNGTNVPPPPPATVGIPGSLGMAKSNCNGGGNNCDVTLSWGSVTGATTYGWQYVDQNNTSYTCNAAAFSAGSEFGSTASTTATIADEYNAIEHACFRVRVTVPAVGDWAYVVTAQL